MTLHLAPLESITPEEFGPWIRRQWHRHRPRPIVASVNRAIRAGRLRTETTDEVITGDTLEARQGLEAPGRVVWSRKAPDVIVVQVIPWRRWNQSKRTERSPLHG